MSMSDTQDDEQDTVPAAEADELPGAGLAAWKDTGPTSGVGAADPRAPVSQFGADAPQQAGPPMPPKDDDEEGPDSTQLPHSDNDMRSPGGHLSDSVHSFMDDAGKMGDQIKNSPVGRGAQMIMRYLTGAGADPAVAKQAEGAATQTLSQVTDAPTQSDVRLVALHEALERGGPDAAEKVQQTYRAAYAAAMGHAHVALNGTDGKPADLAAATDAATQAATYVLDGTHTTYAPGPDGKSVVMSVQYPGNKNPAVSPLTLEQFNQRTDIGDVKGGQYDAVHENPTATGPGKPLQPIGQRNASINGAIQQQSFGGARQGGGAPGQVSPGLAQWRKDNPGVPDPDPGSGASRDNANPDPFFHQPGSRGGAPTGRNPNAGANPDPNLKYRTGSGAPADPGRPFTYASDEGVDPKLAARSHALFPTVGQEQQRLQYIDKMQQQGVTNQQAQDKIDKPFGIQQLKNEGAGALQDKKNEGLQGVAAVKAGAYLQHANIIAASKDHDAAMKMASDVYKAGQQSADRNMQAQGQLLGKEISAAALSGEPLAPQYVEAIAQFSKRVVNAPQAPTPQAAVPQAAAPQAQPAQAPSPQNPAASQFTPPAGQGWQFNAAKGQYRDRQGSLYDKNGKPLAQQ